MQGLAAIPIAALRIINWPMSELGHKRRFDRALTTSGLPHKRTFSGSVGMSQRYRQKRTSVSFARFTAPTIGTLAKICLRMQAASYRRPQDMALINKVVIGARELFHTRVA